MLTSGELYDAFRSEVGDFTAPYLWSDVEAFTYMNDAYTRFARLTGGIPDSASIITQVPILIGVKDAVVSPLILRFRQAYLQSSGQEIVIVNEQDPMLRISNADYGRVQVKNLLMDNTPGPVRRMVIGEGRTAAGGTVRWVQVPIENDTARLSVYRLPLETISTSDMFFAFSDIGAEHIDSLLLRMKARAYGRQDADTFDRTARDYYTKAFDDYCTLAKSEWERFKYKPRVVAYGGI
jgi:hypothetical protein